MLISTGMASMREVARGLDTAVAAGAAGVVLLHCVSAYPAPIEQLNLRAIETLRDAFGVPSGWSDHTTDPTAALAAIALGASVVERHITLDRSLDGPDHRASLDPAAFTAGVRAIRSLEAALGSGRKQIVAAEADVARVARRSLYWHAAGAAGAVVSEADVVALRPAAGLPAWRLDDVVGRRLGRSVEAGALVRDDDLEPEDAG
jgi:N-acetylneuraminate synthase/N,N'-diacetyllegionaminate synthase